VAFLSKYGVARHIYIPAVKRAVVDFAVSADWTPAAGDVKISKDGGAAANVTNLPTAITMGNTAMWDFSITATEMQAAQVMVTVADSATKAVEDTMFVIETYGNASGQHAVDLSDSVRAGLTALPNVASGSAGAIPTTGTGSNQISVSSGQVILQAGTGTGQLDFTSGVVKANATQWLGGTIPAVNVTGVPKVDLVDWLGTAPLSLSSQQVQAVVPSSTVVASVTGAIVLSAKDSFTVRNATAQAGAASSITLDASASATDNFYNGEEVKIDSGTGAGQTRTITAYVGATKVATVDRAWATNPANDSVFTIFNSSAAKLDSNLAVTVGTNSDKTGYTASTVSDKTGYSLTAAYDAAKTASQAGDIMKVSSGTGANQVSLASGLVTVGTNNDKTGYSLTQTFPANFSSFSIDGSGKVALQSPTSLKKNTALANFMFFMIDSSDHVTPKTGLTVTAQRSLDGGAFAACANAVTEVANGWYKINLAATDTNADVIAFKFTSAAADQTNILATTNS
jgi:hypothetical protein